MMFSEKKKSEYFAFENFPDKMVDLCPIYVLMNQANAFGLQDKFSPFFSFFIRAIVGVSEFLKRNHGY